MAASRWAACLLAAILAAPAFARAALPVEAVNVTASAPPRHASPRRAPVPAANFLVEWRIQPVGAASSRGDVVITSNSAATGGVSGFGPGAVVVGTARAAAPQAVRVANGHEAEMRFDKSTTRTVYDMSYAASSSSESGAVSSTQGASGVSGASASQSRSRSRDQGAASHEVVVHRVDGLRVTPHWTQGDTLLVDLQLTHGAPTGGSDAGASQAFDFTSTLALSFDEWQSVASVGDGGEELQVRVTWR